MRKPKCNHKYKSEISESCSISKPSKYKSRYHNYNDIWKAQRASGLIFRSTNVKDKTWIPNSIPSEIVIKEITETEITHNVMFILGIDK